MFDLDHFKAVNDRYGHQAGDKVIQETASRLRETLRSSDILARFGGEEFVALLPNTDTQGASIIAQKCRRAIASLNIPFDDAQLSITVSIGISRSIDLEGVSIELLISEADRAMYSAKEQGRNRVVSF